jgi:predicted RNA-binding protein YlqC (UPF0109 family)
MHKVDLANLQKGNNPLKLSDQQVEEQVGDLEATSLKIKESQSVGNLLEAQYKSFLKSIDQARQALEDKYDQLHQEAKYAKEVMEMSMKTLALKQENLKRDEYFRKYLEMIEHEREREERLKEMEEENESLQSTLNNMRKCRVITIEVQVEESMIGQVIGRKGQTVTKIMQATGTNIETRPKGIFWVTGTEEQCQHAKKKIETMIGEKRQSMVITTKVWRMCAIF